MANAGIRVGPRPPQSREHEEVPCPRSDRARRALLGATDLRPLIPGIDGDQASLALERLRVELAGRELVVASIEGEVLGDEGSARCVRGQVPPEVAGCNPGPVYETDTGDAVGWGNARVRDGPVIGGTGGAEVLQNEALDAFLHPHATAQRRSGMHTRSER